MKPGDDDFFDLFQRRVRGTSRKAIGFWRSPWGWAAAAVILILATVGALWEARIAGNKSVAPACRPRSRGTAPGESSLCAVEPNSGRSRPELSMLVGRGRTCIIEEGTSLEPGHLRLAAGLVQLEFLNGASVDHRGSLRLRVDLQRQGLLSSRQAAGTCAAGARVSQSRHPAIAWSSMGTEFAMRVDQRGARRIHVVEGEVELHGAGTTPREQPGQDPAVWERRRISASKSGRERSRRIRPAFVDRSRLIELEGANHRERHRRWLDQARRCGRTLHRFSTIVLRISTPG